MFKELWKKVKNKEFLLCYTKIISLAVYINELKI